MDQGTELHGTRSLATTPRKGEKEASAAASGAPDSLVPAPRSGLADDEPAAAHLGFKTGAGKTLQLAEPSAGNLESFFGGLWPELSKLGARSCQERPELLAAQLGASEDHHVEAPCDAEGDEQPSISLEPGYLQLEPPDSEDAVIPLFPPGCFPKGRPLALLLETQAAADAASDSLAGATRKRAKHTQAPR